MVVTERFPVVSQEFMGRVTYLGSVNKNSLFCKSWPQHVFKWRISCGIKLQAHWLMTQSSDAPSQLDPPFFTYDFVHTRLHRWKYRGLYDMTAMFLTPTDNINV